MQVAPGAGKGGDVVSGPEGSRLDFSVVRPIGLPIPQLQSNSVLFLTFKFAVICYGKTRKPIPHISE